MDFFSGCRPLKACLEMHGKCTTKKLCKKGETNVGMLCKRKKKKCICCVSGGKFFLFLLSPLFQRAAR